MDAFQTSGGSPPAIVTPYNTQRGDIQRATQECGAAWGDVKRNGLKLGETLYKWIESEAFKPSRGGFGSEGEGLQGFLGVLRNNGVDIPIHVATYWVAEHKFSKGISGVPCEYCSLKFPSKNKLGKHIHKNHPEIGERARAAKVSQVEAPPRATKPADDDDTSLNSIILISGTNLREARTNGNQKQIRKWENILKAAVADSAPLEPVPNPAARAPVIIDMKDGMLLRYDGRVFEVESEDGDPTISPVSALPKVGEPPKVGDIFSAETQTEDGPAVRNFEVVFSETVFDAVVLDGIIRRDSSKGLWKAGDIRIEYVVRETTKPAPATEPVEVPGIESGAHD